MSLIQDKIPKSRITIKYKSTLEGAYKWEILPYCQLVLADLGTDDKKTPLHVRGIRTVKELKHTMKDMNVNLSITTPNKTQGGDESLKVDLKFEKMSDFSPDAIAEQVPQIRTLLQLKQLLTEGSTSVHGTRKLKEMYNKLVASPEALKKVMGELKDLQETLTIPDRSESQVKEAE